MISPIFDENLKGYFYKGRFTPDHCIYRHPTGVCYHVNRLFHECPYEPGTFKECRHNLLDIRGVPG